MKKLKRFIALVLILCTLCVVMPACETQVAIPTDLNIDVNYKLTWTEVDEARNYVISIENVDSGDTTEVMSRRNYYSLSGLDEGVYSIKVKSVAGDEKSVDSDWSESIPLNKGYENGCIYTLINNMEYEVTKVGTASGDIIIEDYYRNKPVTSIAAGAFKGSTRVESIVIGNNVTSIGDNAFYNCKKLTSVTIPSSVVSIGTAAFQGCNLLTSITLPDSITEISDYAFAYCRGLTEINFGNNVTTIKDSAFADCSELTELTIPDSVVTIGPYAFASDTALKTITIGSSVKTIGEYAFSHCGFLENVNFSQEGSLETIDQYAFSDTKISSINIPEGVTSLGYASFYNCDQLNEVTIPETVVSVGASAFAETKVYKDQVNAKEPFIFIDDWMVYCPAETLVTIEKIEEDTFGRNVVGIADQVFARCPKLEEVYLPSSVKYIGKYSFYQNENLSLFETKNNSLLIIAERAFRGCPKLTQIYLGEGLQKIGSYAFYDCTALNNNSFSSIIPDSVTSIGTYAFKNTKLWQDAKDGIVYAGNWVVGYNGLSSKTVTLKTEVAGISDYAFYQCETLEALEGLGNAKYLGYGAFYECTSLATINLPRSLKVIEDYTFYKCSSLFQLSGGKDSIPVALTSVGRSAFYKCSNLNSIDLSNGKVTEVKAFAFYGCEKLQTVDLGKSLKTLGEKAFYKCTSLQSVVIPNDVTKIEDKVFYKCESLESVQLGTNVVEIGEYAFSGCSSLQSIIIPDSVVTISNYAFYKCTAVTELTIGNSVEKIGNYAFYSLGKITSLNLPQSLNYIGSYAFKGCEGLTSLVLSSSVIELGAHSFYGCKNMTVYTDAEKPLDAWNVRWNSSYRPVVWGCELSDDNSYVVSVTVTETTLSNATKIISVTTEETDENGEPIIKSETVNQLTAPVREGYVFAGWATENGGEVVYSATEILDVSVGTTLYAVWDEDVAEEQPEQQN